MISGTTREKTAQFSVMIYAGLMSVVWIEPAPADVWFVPAFLLAVPFMWNMRKELLAAGLPFLVPLVVSLSWTYLIGGPVHLRFFLIDVYLLGVFLWVYCVVRIAPDKDALIEGVFLAWTVVLTICIVICFLALAVGQSYLFGTVLLLRSGVRFQGFFKDPNVMASAIIPALLFTFHRAIRSDTKRAWLYAVGMIFLGIGLIFTFSRAAWLAAFLAFITQTVFLLIRGTRVEQLRILALFSAGALALVALLLVNPPMVNRDWPLQNIFFKRFQIESYDSARFAAWRAALRLILEKPLFGIGTGAFESYNGLSIHNTYLRFLVERGLLGVAGVLAFFYIQIKRRVVRAKGQELLLFAIIGLSVNMVFIDALHWRHLVLLVAVFFGTFAPEPFPQAAALHSRQ